MSSLRPCRKSPKSGGASLRPCRNGLSQEEPLAAWRQVLDGMPAWRQVLRWHGPETPHRRFGSIWIKFDHFGPVRTFPDLCVETYFLGYTLGNKFPRVSEKMIDSEPSRNHRFHRFGRLERPREPSQTARGTRTLRTWSRGLP